jgi:hypothetical protein
VSNPTPNTVPAALVFATPTPDDPGGYAYRYYPVAAWDTDGMALVVVPGHARFVRADNPDMFRGKCWGVQLTPSPEHVAWRQATDTGPVMPQGNGPFF